MKNSVSTLFLVISMSLAANFAFASDTSDSEDQEEQSSGVVSCSKAVCKKTANAIGYFLNKLGSPEGAVAVGSAYAGMQAVSNFMWAFNWQEHAGFSEELHQLLQEIGGLSASAECIILGILIPVMLYIYKRKTTPDEEKTSLLPGKS